MQTITCTFDIYVKLGIHKKIKIYYNHQIIFTEHFKLEYISNNEFLSTFRRRFKMEQKLDERLGLNNTHPFEVNNGQNHKDIKYSVTKDGYMVMFLKDGIIMGLKEVLKDNVPNNGIVKFNGEEQYLNTDKIKTPIHFFKITFKDSLTDVVIIGEDEGGGKRNYFGANLPKEGITDISMYSRIRYKGVYPGIDLVFYFNNEKLEYDFILQPRANPKIINMAFEGIDDIKLDNRKNVEIKVKNCNTSILRPNAYQVYNGVKIDVSSKFNINENILSIDVNNYDKAIPLIIDPVLGYSTYLGGFNADIGNGIANDKSGNTYVTGFTNSVNFPSTIPVIGQPYNNTEAIIVTKYNQMGQMIYSTVINGSSIDIGTGIVADSIGNVYVTGQTISPSTDFPTTVTIGSTNNSYAIFIFKLNTAGDKLSYFTYINGNDSDLAFSIDLDINNNAYITGDSFSTNWDTIIPSNYTNFGSPLVGNIALFVCKLNQSGDISYFSTLSGNFTTSGRGIAVDKLGSAYIGGETFSTVFGSLNPNIIGVNDGSSKALAIKLSPTGKALSYFTLISGSGTDDGRDIDIDTLGNAYIVGNTSSSDFPRVPAENIIGTAPGRIFVSKLDPTGTSLIYSVTLGGGGVNTTDFVTSVVVDNCNRAYITGATDSKTFPLQIPIYPDKQREQDVFISRLNPEGTDFEFSTYFGGNGNDIGNGIAVNASNNIYVTGFTESTNLPLKSSQQSMFGGITDAFVLKILDADMHEEIDLKDIYNLITNPRHDLEEIKREIRNIERALKATIVRIEARNREIQNKLDYILSVIECDTKFGLTTGRIRRDGREGTLIINIDNHSMKTAEIEILRKNRSNEKASDSISRILVEPYLTRELTFDNIPVFYEVEIRGISSEIEVKVGEIGRGEGSPYRDIRLSRIPEPRKK